jgi:cell division protease FtsH
MTVPHRQQTWPDQETRVAAPKYKLPSSTWLIFFGLFLVTALGIFSGGGAGSATAIPYSQFQTYLDAGKVKQVTVSGDLLRGTLTEAMPDGKTAFTTIQVPADLADTLAKHGVEFSGVSSGGPLSTILSWILPPLLFVGVWMLASRSMMGGGMGGRGGLSGGLFSIGRSRAKLITAETKVPITFEDVAGVDEAKAELHEIVDFLKRRVWTARCPYPPRYPAGRAAGHRQDLAGPSRRR